VESKIIVALDGMDWEVARRLARSLRDEVWGFKVNDALIDKGLDCVHELKNLGVNVFADPKLHDIPNTVGNAVKKIVRAGADIITVHAMGGFDMLRAAVAEGGPRIAAVSLLTSMGDDDCIEVFGGFRRNILPDLLKMPERAGVSKLICGVPDLDLVGIRFFTIVPGIRVEQTVDDDQKNRGIPKNGTYGLTVVGRPITKAPDPVAAAKLYNQILNDA